VNPNTLQLIQFIEQLAALVATSVVDLKNVISGASSKTVDQILDDADSTYDTIIAAAKVTPPPTA
jgi:hypothetical protein